MANKLQPPRDLSQEPFFAVTYEREEMVYILALPSGQSFDLGEPDDALRYFDRAGVRNVGERAMDTAFNFHAAAANPSTGRVMRVDLTGSINETELLFGNLKEMGIAIG